MLAPSSQSWPVQRTCGKGLSAARILGDLQMRLGAIQEAFVITIAPPPVRGIGTAGGFKMMIQDRRDRGVQALETVMQELVQAGNGAPVARRVFPFNARTPRIYADIDRVRAEMLGVSVDRVFETLEVYLGSVFVNEFNFLGRTFRVTAQADGDSARK